MSPVGSSKLDFFHVNFGIMMNRVVLVHLHSGVIAGNSGSCEVERDSLICSEQINPVIDCQCADYLVSR